MNYSNLIRHILNAVGQDAISFPARKATAKPSEARAAAIIEKSEAQIGAKAIRSDYYLSSRDRFETLLRLSLGHIREGGRVLDVGNAPGYLAIMLAEAGYDIDGVNLSAEWNSTYPDAKYITQFRVIAADVEKQALPYADKTFDAIVLTEVLEHIAITHPEKILAELSRVLTDDGVVIFSTPNVCNISNIIALLKGLNLFWAPDIFYGSTDRHNREWSPNEVLRLFEDAGFEAAEFFGMNDHANWRHGAAQHIYDFQDSDGTPDHALMRNTIVGAFKLRAK